MVVSTHEFERSQLSWVGSHLPGANAISSTPPFRYNIFIYRHFHSSGSCGKCQPGDICEWPRCWGQFYSSIWRVLWNLKPQENLITSTCLLSLVIFRYALGKKTYIFSEGMFRIYMDLWFTIIHITFHPPVPFTPKNCCLWRWVVSGHRCIVAWQWRPLGVGFANRGRTPAEEAPHSERYHLPGCAKEGKSIRNTCYLKTVFWFHSNQDMFQGVSFREGCFIASEP